MKASKKKIVLGCLGVMVLLAAICGGELYWLVYCSPETAPIVRNTAATLYWHKRVNPEDMQQVRRFCKRFGYNDDYYLECDFGKASGKKRFYLYDLNTGERLMSSYCMHGKGGGSTAAKPVFSNRPGSNCSSVGLYALCGIGSNSIKNSIKLEGLDMTNFNARARGILIHTAGKVTRFHGQSKYIPLGIESNGCFTIELPCLLRLMTDYSLHGKRKRILLWAHS